MRWVVTGRGGQLGSCLVDALEARPGEVLLAAVSHEAVDVTSERDVERLLAERGDGADVLVNAAAFTAVDRCEAQEDRAFAVNGVAPGLLAEKCREAGVALVHVSTDYVFDGQGRAPYREDAELAPATAYGRGKAEGERRVLAAGVAALVVRTSWVFGPGRNFVAAILDQAARRCRGEVAEPMRVVDDQRGTPTYAADLAEGLIDLALLAFGPGPASASDERVRGLFHLTNAGETTWWEFARAILDLAGHAAMPIDRIATADLDLPAPRPAYSVLDCGRAAGLGVRLRPWRDALEAYLGSAAGRSLLEAAS